MKKMCDFKSEGRTIKKSELLAKSMGKKHVIDANQDVSKV